MMRIEYCEEEDHPNQFALQEANTERCLKGKRGRALLTELRAALLALPAPRLIEGKLACGGEVCTVGALILHRRLTGGADHKAVLEYLEQVGPQDDDEYDAGSTVEAAQGIGVPHLLAWKLVALNDLELEGMTPEARYTHVLEWVEGYLREVTPPRPGEGK